jgi:protease IV
VKFAATKAELGEDFRVTEYPRKKQFAEQFKESLEGRKREQAFSGPLGGLIRAMAAELEALNRLNDPKGLYARLPFELGLN